MRRKPLFPPQASAATEKKKRNKGRPSYRVRTINGRVVLRRTRWHCPQEGSCTPMDGVVDRAERTVSQGVREMTCRLNQSASSFEKTATNLSHAAQVDLSKELVRQVVEAEGKAVVAAQKAGQLRPTWKAEDCAVEEGKTRVYLGCDGVKVPLVTDEEKKKRRQKTREKRRRRGRKCKPLPPAKAGADNAYKEFRVVGLYDEGNEHCHVVATPGDHEVVGRLMQREANRVGLHRANEKVANVDGAVWIRNEIDLYGLVDAIGLDFYHLGENVQKARFAVYGQESPEGKQWVGELLHCFKHEGYTAAWGRLTRWKASLRSAPKKKAAKTLMHYVSERQPMIQYPEFRARGWQIGSGPTEALCKTTTKRIKGSGRRWDAKNAEAIAALACLDQSNAWDAYWFAPAPSLN